MKMLECIVLSSVLTFLQNIVCAKYSFVLQNTLSHPGHDALLYMVNQCSSRLCNHHGLVDHDVADHKTWSILFDVSRLLKHNVGNER